MKADSEAEPGPSVYNRTLPEGANMLRSFGHLMNQYSAGYYGYLWAEVLATDAYMAFEDLDPEDADGLVALGERFWAEVLSVGGSRHPMESFAAFRGREPSTTALLRRKGLLSQP